MEALSQDDKLALLQHAITKYDLEDTLKEKLKDYLAPREVERLIDTLIATQKVRRIGSDTLQNNVSHIGELPEPSESVARVLSAL